VTRAHISEELKKSPAGPLGARDGFAAIVRDQSRRVTNSRRLIRHHRFEDPRRILPKMAYRGQGVCDLIRSASARLTHLDDGDQRAVINRLDRYWHCSRHGRDNHGFIPMNKVSKRSLVGSMWSIFKPVDFSMASASMWPFISFT
jgi:hypothetical protein